MSPDQGRATKRRRVAPADDHDEQQVLPLAVPPLAVHAAPPSPPSPPLSSISALALFAAEMVAWLWFAPSPPAAGAAAVDRGQVRPTDRFVRFCQEVLATTQVSESVVLLALLFISRLKQRNPINGAPGSEYRLAVTGLMLANKILDDNTSLQVLTFSSVCVTAYTAQTWSQVSSLELKPLVAGEAEFLRGLDWQLHVTGRDFEAWRKLLDGHVAARNARIGRLPAPSRGLGDAIRRSSSSVRARGRVKQGDLRGLGIGLEGDAPRPPPQTLAPPPSFVETSAARYPLARRGVVASATTTPTSAFATYSFGAASAPPKANPTSSASLPQYAASTHASEPPRGNPLEVSPTAIAFYRRNSGLRASAPSAVPGGMNRTVDDAFRYEAPLPFVAPALPLHVQPQQAGDMVRSYSAGPAASSASMPAYGAATATPIAAAPAFFLHPAHHVTPIPFAMSSSPQGSRPSSSSSSAASGHPPPPFFFHEQPAPPHTGFSTLLDAFSPRYEPEERHRMRHVSLGYYSLAAGHGLGHLRQTLPPPPAATAWPFVPYGMHFPTHYAPSGVAPAPIAYPPPPRPVPYSASTSPTAPPPFDAFAQQQQRYPIPTPPYALYPGVALAAPPMMTSASASQFAAMPPPRPHGHRRTSSGGQSLRGAGGGGGSPSDLTSTPVGATGAPTYSPAQHPHPHPHHLAHVQHGLPWPAQLPQPVPVPHAGYYSSYSNAGVPGVYYRG